MKRGTFALVLLFVSCVTCWGKIKKDEQEYFDGQFAAVTSQITALQQALKASAVQIDALQKQLLELQTAQKEIRETMDRQANAIGSMDNSMSSMRITHQEDFSSVKDSLRSLLSQQSRFLEGATRQPIDATSLGAASPAPAVPQTAPPLSSTGQQSAVLRHYVTSVDGDVYTVDMGSSVPGVRPGLKLFLYKAGNESASVGELEVTDVLNATNSRAKVSTISPGTKVEFGDIVRIEQ